MPKFKIGDSVKGKDYQGNWVFTGTVIERPDWAKNSIYSKDAVWAFWRKNVDNPFTKETYLREDMVELISPPTFEVGKKYTLNSDGHIVEVVYESDNQYILKNRIGNLFVVRDCDFCYYAPYTPPPPEEWRALYWRANNKPEISAYIWDSKEDVEKDEKSHPHFMYAIRTDINAKKEKF